VTSVARLVALLGAVGLGLFLTARSARDVVLVYDVGETPRATRLEVELRRGGDLVRRAEFSVAAGTRQVRHALRLPEGDYQLRYRLGSEVVAASTGERTLTVEDEGTIVLPLGS
jgi:hypothetical protein